MKEFNFFIFLFLFLFFPVPVFAADGPSWDDSGDTESSGDSPSWDDAEKSSNQKNPSWDEPENKTSESEGPAWAGDEEKKSGENSKYSDNSFKIGFQLIPFSYKSVYNPKPYNGVSFDLIKSCFLYFGYQFKRNYEFGINVSLGMENNDSLFDGTSAFRVILAPYFQGNIALTKNLFLPIQISLGLNLARGDFDYTDFVIFPSIGLQYRFHEHASFDFMLRVSYSVGDSYKEEMPDYYKHEAITVFPTTGFTVWF